ncbi:hypothetical protein C7C56_018325 [Massilia glaciei]|uniref:DUF3592 domain-containing protein n=1 Tax=Massilia glaciei TaxID=1524097 RepID=A0A2U2HHD8_9BURK|nr:hypothetical protein C7C56_018325 [Massilia glaciei]
MTYLALAAFFLGTGIYIGIAPARGLLFFLFESEPREARIVSGDPASKARAGRPIYYEYAQGGAIERSRWHYPDREIDGGKSGRNGALAYPDPLDHSRVVVSVVKRFPGVSCLVREFNFGKMVWNGIVGLGLMLLGLGALGVAFVKAGYFK